MKLVTVGTSAEIGLTREASTPLNVISQRERQVIALVARGLANKEIAEILSITPMTVKHHLSHIFCKLDLDSRVELALFAVEHGLVNTSSSSSFPQAPAAQGPRESKQKNPGMAPLGDDSAPREVQP